MTSADYLGRGDIVGPQNQPPKIGESVHLYDTAQSGKYLAGGSIVPTVRIQT